MMKNNYNVIGVMSGTSLDGVDLAYCKFSFDGGWNFQIVKAETVSYSSEWKKKLKYLVELSKGELSELDKDYTLYLAEIIIAFIQEHHITEIDAICSHGHTALHEPHKGLTYQIGNLPELSIRTNKTVVCDFRVEDVALGGQGAPLVPIGDQHLFNSYRYCLNLGGFANISYEEKGRRVAYDICPVNIVLNHYVASMGLDFDRDGAISASGAINLALLEKLNALEYYNLPAPKSLGLEWVKDVVFPIIDSFKLKINDVLRTFVEHCAIQIAAVKPDEPGLLLITGGGAFNEFFIKTLSAKSSNNLFLPEPDIINYKEALIFAFLGVLKLRGENNCLSSVTGAKKDHSSGKIYYP